MLLTCAIGDVHGCLDKLQSVIAQCEAFANDRPVSFVLLGDFIDRGPDSAGVVDFLIALQAKQPDRFVALLGNHEAMALSVIDGLAMPDLWLSQGGAETLRSYGVGNARALPREPFDWLRSLQLSCNDGRRFFVHAGIDPDKPFDAQDEHALLWTREPFLSDARDHGRLIVHGHTPVPGGQPDLRGNRLNLDTGAVFGGPLTAAIFDAVQTDPIRFIQAV